MISNDSIFAELGDVLAALYSDNASLSRVIKEAGLDVTRIDLGSNIRNNWSAALDEASKVAKLNNLVNFVLKEYGTNSGLIQVSTRLNKLFNNGSATPVIDTERSLIEKDIQNTPIVTYKQPIIKLLFLTANPSMKSWVKIGRESYKVDKFLRDAQIRDTFDIRNHRIESDTDLERLLSHLSPTIVHFSGVGSHGIALKAGESGIQPVPVERLRTSFAKVKSCVKCVVLSGCYSETQIRAITEHVDCIIGMSDTIKDEDADQLVQYIYKDIGSGLSIKEIFRTNRNLIQQVGGAKTFYQKVGKSDPNILTEVYREAGYMVAMLKLDQPFESYPQEEQARMLERI